MAGIIGTTLGPIGKICIMVLAGVIGAKTNILDETATNKVTDVVMLLISPCMLFTSFLMEKDTEKSRGFLIAIALAVVVHVLGILISTVLIKRKDGDAWDVARVCTTISNCGFIGLPLIQSMYGSEAVFYLTAYIMVASIVNWTWVIMLLSGTSSLKGVIKALFSPCLISIYLGIIAYVTQVQLPEIITAPLSSIGNCNTPLALMIAGASASRANFKDIMGSKLTYKVLALRHFIIPLVLLAGLKLIGLTSLPAVTMFILAACPVGATPAMYAVKCGRDGKFGAGVFGLSTVLCLITLPLMIAVMQMVF